jgi:hypothetical protein
LFRGCLGDVRRYDGLCRVHVVSDTAQVELKKWTSVGPWNWDDPLAFRPERWLETGGTA